MRGVCALNMEALGMFQNGANEMPRCDRAYTQRKKDFYTRKQIVGLIPLFNVFFKKNSVIFSHT